MKDHQTTVGIKYSDNEISDVRTFLQNKKTVFSSMSFLNDPNFSLLPFQTFRLLLDNLPESKWDIITDDLKKLLDQFYTLDKMCEIILKWCIMMKKSPRNEIYFTRSDKIKNRIEFFWEHNLGINTNNFSQMFYFSLEKSNILKNWKIHEDKTLGIKSLSLIFEKIT